jgi:hypothetical protein
MFVVKNLHFPPWMVKSCEIHHGIHKLVGGIPTPLKNMSSSMGRMTSHI